jgi:hypothetical protein
MTVVNNESPDITQPVDTNLSHKESDTNLNQNIPENQSTGQEPPEDVNWKAFREARKKDRQEREAAERKAADKEAEVAALKAAMEAAFSKSAPSPQAYQQYYGMQQSYDPPEETEDSRIEKKVNALLASREEKARQEQAEREYREYPTKLKRDYPDIHDVCSQENLDYLDYHYPELSRPLQRLPEGYDKWSDIYHAVKKFIPNHATSKKDSLRADINMQKPKSISSMTPSPSGTGGTESWKEQEERRAANWARMQRTLKQV